MNENNSQTNVNDRFEQRQARREERWKDREAHWEERLKRREERWEMHRGGAWIWGVLLILLAGMLFLRNANIYVVNNWWAFFILLPAMGAFTSAWAQSRLAGGRFTRRARSGAIVGIWMVIITAMFLFNLNWIILGPVLLALAGLSLIINGMLPD